jgi:hypothetical protein
MAKYRIERHTTIDFFVAKVEGKSGEIIARCYDEETAKKLVKFFKKEEKGQD